jgi:peptidoglycan/xylan/chitin deacetylase (PgdA/CDA1 family)
MASPKLSNKTARISRNIVILFLCYFWLTQPPAQAAATSSLNATVLIYHHFGVDKYPTTNVSVERFREQMVYLAANNYRVIPLAELVEALHSHKPLPPKAVVITIDDGYISVYRNAWPILKTFGYPFTVFINGDSIERDYANYMSWAEVREMRQSGVDFQDHSYSHNHMADLPPGITEPEYQQWLREDLKKNAAAIYAQLGAKPQFFAVPYGEYNQQLIEAARQLGYEAVLTQDPGSISQATDPFLIPREPILGLEWATMEHFQEILQRVDLPIADLKPPFGSGAEAPPSFGARILDPQRYVDTSFEIYVSELGWLDSKLTGDIVRAPGGKILSRKLNRVMVKAREKASGRIAVRSWLLVGENGD